MKHERDWLFCNAIRIPQAVVRCEDLKPSLRCVQCSPNARGGVESRLREMAEGARLAVSQEENNLELAGCDTTMSTAGVPGNAGKLAGRRWDSGKMA
jgi:hypothetical protein